MPVIFTSAACALEKLIKPNEYITKLPTFIHARLGL